MGAMLIDPKKVLELVNEGLRMRMGNVRLMDGPVFTATVEAIVEALNAALEPLMNPVIMIKSPPPEKEGELRERLQKLDSWRSAMTGLGNAMPKPMLMLHDEIVREENHHVAALMHAATAEPKLMQQWYKPVKMSNHAYRCTNHSCPPRAPISSQLAPTCYTCGTQMEKA